MTNLDYFNKRLGTNYDIAYFISMYKQNIHNCRDCPVYGMWFNDATDICEQANDKNSSCETIWKNWLKKKRG